MNQASFVLLFQEKPATSGSTSGAATKTATAGREEPDMDIGAMAAATQTFTETVREEPDTDPFRAGTLGLEPRVTVAGMATRTDSREEPDQAHSLGRAGTSFVDEHNKPDRPTAGVGKQSFVWFANANNDEGTK